MPTGKPILCQLHCINKTKVLCCKQLEVMFTDRVHRNNMYIHVKKTEPISRYFEIPIPNTGPS